MNNRQIKLTTNMMQSANTEDLTRLRNAAALDLDTSDITAIEARIQDRLDIIQEINKA